MSSDSVDPDGPSETEFEYAVVQALSCAYPKYRCVTFGGTFVLDGAGRRPDLALVAHDFSHWFVIEVELVGHSLARHVLPQVRTFAFGDPQSDCISVLAERLDIDIEKAKTLLAYVPRSVAVVANRWEADWFQSLRALNVQLLAVSVYRGGSGTAVEIEGDLQVIAEHLGFGMYSAVDKSMRFPSSVRLPRGCVQLFDMTGVVASWTVREGIGIVWVTKDRGIPDIPDGSYMQVVRTLDGRLAIRRPTK